MKKLLITTLIFSQLCFGVNECTKSTNAYKKRIHEKFVEFSVAAKADEKKLPTILLSKKKQEDKDYLTEKLREKLDHFSLANQKKAEGNAFEILQEALKFAYTEKDFVRTKIPSYRNKDTNFFIETLDDAIVLRMIHETGYFISYMASHYNFSGLKRGSWNLRIGSRKILDGSVETKYQHSTIDGIDPSTIISLLQYEQPRDRVKLAVTIQYALNALKVNDTTIDKFYKDAYNKASSIKEDDPLFIFATSSFTKISPNELIKILQGFFYMELSGYSFAAAGANGGYGSIIYAGDRKTLNARSDYKTIITKTLESKDYKLLQNYKKYCLNIPVSN
jgi:hypothetical protein